MHSCCTNFTALRSRTVRVTAGIAARAGGLNCGHPRIAHTRNRAADAV
jgi:hypothetical protein